MSAGISLGTVASVVGIAGGLNSMGVFGSKSGGGGGSTASGGQAQTAVDPFASYRPGEAAQYDAAMKSGGTVDPTQMPGYSQWMSGVLNPAMESTQGKLAAAGMSGSGAEKQALQVQAQQGYSGFMTDYMNRLAQGSGAVQNPANGGNAMVSQGNANASNYAAGLGGVAQGLSGLSGYFGGGTPTGNTTGWTSGGGVSMSSSDQASLAGLSGYGGGV